MVTIKEYTVIQEYGIPTLVDKVNHAIQDGWQPHGGICCVIQEINKEIGQIGFLYSQSLVKYES